jgi:hypothetical protein
MNLQHGEDMSHRLAVMIISCATWNAAGGQRRLISDIAWVWEQSGAAAVERKELGICGGGRRGGMCGCADCVGGVATAAASAVVGAADAQWRATDDMCAPLRCCYVIPRNPGDYKQLTGCFVKM